MNNKGILDKVDAGDSRLGRWLAANLADEKIIENIYLATLTRRPTPAELGFARRHIGESRTRNEGLQDLQHALLNSNEFLFRH